jgi:hypothetical protein
VRDIWATARRESDELTYATIADPDPNLPRDGIKPGQWVGAPHDTLPPGCPVQVIGCDGDGVVWCRTATGDLRSILKWDMATITDLFAPLINFAFWAWPAFGKAVRTDPETGEVMELLVVKRIERDKLFTCLCSEAKRRPLFDPEKQHRGRGGWTDGNGEFIWHSGKHLWKIAGGRLAHVPPAQHDGMLYTRQPSTIEPWDGEVAQDESPARRILEDLRSWNWERPFLDPILALGWMVTALMGGALKVRPIVFTTGGAGVGKSTLHELFKNVLDNVVFATVDTTAAGIYQRMKHDALPIMVDEMESKPGSTKATNVIELARVAYTEGTTFRMHSSFFFSAINVPPMGIQDRTRMAILNLARLDDTQSGIGRKVVVKNDTDGRMILRQIMDDWYRFETVYLPRWWDLLAGQKLDSRAIDTYGTLLAAAEMVLGDAAIEACGLPINDAEQLAAIIGQATAPDRSDQLENWHRCINHLMGSAIDAWRDGKRPTVGGVMAAMMTGGADRDAFWARERLELVNLSARDRGDLDDPGGGPYLAVPPDGPQLEKLFANTVWHQGVWNTALKQAVSEGVVIVHRSKAVIRINGTNRRCLLIDMAAFGKYGEGI